MSISCCGWAQPVSQLHAYSRPHAAFVLLGSLFFVLLAGCGGGPKLYKAKGVVNIDGKPTGGVNLMFYKQGTNELTSIAKSDSDGSFSPYTTWENESREGIPAGKYQVAATYPDPKYKPEPTGRLMGGSVADPPDLFKNHYANPSPELTVDIESADSAPVVNLVSKVKKK